MPEPHHRSSLTSVPSLVRNALTVGLAFTARSLSGTGAAARALVGGAERDIFEVARTMPSRHVGHFRAGRRGMCIIDAHMPQDRGFALPSSRNHAEYAQRHDYTHISFHGRISQELFFNPPRGPLTDKHAGGLYWQALVGVSWAMEQQRASGDSLCEWVMWMDNDAIFTNFEHSAEMMVKNIRAERKMMDLDVILSREDTDYPGTFINSGVYFVHNSGRGRQFLREVAALWPQYKDRDHTDDQRAMTEVVFGRDPAGLPMELRGELEANMPSYAVAVPQRLFNAFKWRGDLTHDTRTSELSEWEPQDFVLHIASRNAKERRELIVAADAATPRE